MSASIHERVGADVAELLAAVAVVEHHVEPLAVVLPLRDPLGLDEERAEEAPVALAAGAPQGEQSLLPGRAERLEELVFQADEELAAAGVALAAGAAEELPVDPQGLMPLGADDVQPAGGD